ncbi:helix-turn-helix domain-containing protein [Phaeobacter gallaeciensis]|uniref:transposase n=2 Tax=Phaeobacter gallaeciensis TaxID=60890 RepID=UPI00237FBEA6|nr:helix-turn-helix domain-containing protein [Phaeobacter gallaeciensis]MDE4153676.1 helix-turn-helix domain-containing protein [Phaeobacter gallaeciensis]MDE4229066.1 helix-turn-helix domain-containing protein [Phaeobacter gallaeciensis]MDE4258141.1 helix-turn-helix domain-containing protein [Phaeobacter gallaeciensis]MDE4266567.1 helix-turn-helix domain-containing protein [Phaeobacter gallaeciensis]MDE4368125.1 helix-turn-helix domain-containing protein [Phaeobacter gallaeciensis]
MMPEEVKVWGITVPVSPTRRRKWPDALRAKAVRKILAGAGIRETAEEIGTNKSLVALWVKKADTSGKSPAFVEFVAPAVQRLAELPHEYGHETASSTSCRISIGTAAIEIPPGYPADHLEEVLRAVRAAQ